MIPKLRRMVQMVKEAHDDASALHDLVAEVAVILGADACSLFLVNYSSSQFVLMATEGLAPEAVGELSVPVQEGLIGYICQRQEQIRLKDARKHPAFLPVEGLGEEPFRALLGVPIINQRQVVGVLVAQRRGRRSFSQRDEAYAFTLSVHLASYFAQMALRRLLVPGQQADHNQFWQGTPASAGLAIGQGVVVVHDTRLENIPDRECADPAAEIRQFRRALVATRQELRELSAKLSSLLGQQEMALFDAYEKMLMDNTLGRDIEGHIRAGQWAPGALRRTIGSYVQQLMQVDDPYLRERVGDLRDLARRLLAQLKSERERVEPFPPQTILIANEVSATMLAEVPRKKLVGVVSLRGSATSHGAILARALGVPAVYGIKDSDLTSFSNASLVVDGYTGHIVVEPQDNVLEHYRELLDEEQVLARRLQRLKSEPAVTTDGKRVNLLLNIGIALDRELDVRVGAEGIGLYRTELSFMLEDHFPAEEEQAKIYRRVLKKMKGKPVVIRTLDIGGDKALSYFPIKDRNPFLGWRGIRVTLDHPEIFLVQIRAMLRADLKCRNLHIALPMIAHVAELDESLALIHQAYREVLEENGLSEVDYARPPVGLVVEVPSVIYQIRVLARRVDFITIGTNDLTQYLLAIDRTNERVSGWFDPLHPSVLQAIRLAVRGARRAGIPVHVCGEMAADPLGACLLLGMGIDALSMNGTSIGRIRQLIRAMSLQDAQKILRVALSRENASDVRIYLQQQFERLKLGALIRAGA